MNSTNATGALAREILRCAQDDTKERPTPFVVLSESCCSEEPRRTLLRPASATHRSQTPRSELGARGFTLLEVMVAIAILGTALVSLLSLHHQSMQSVIRAQEMTRASMLAQAVMTEAELERFPDLGRSTGDFQSSFPGQFQDFRWERNVEASANFPDVREVKIFVRYGPGQSRSFALVEFLHSPIPPDPNTGQFQ